LATSEFRSNVFLADIYFYEEVRDVSYESVNQVEKEKYFSPNMNYN
jgi:hypothetical protein